MSRAPRKLPRASRSLAACAALVWLLVACSTSPAPAPRAAVPAEPTRAAAPEFNPLAPPKGPVRSLPLHRTSVPQGDGVPARLRPHAPDDVVVELRALLISAYPLAEADVEPTLHAWFALLEQTGMPYEHIVASDPSWTAEALADHLVGPDGVGRFQAVLLTTNNLTHQVGDEFVSAFSADQWQVLFDYERAYDVRQAALYGATSKWSTPAEDDYGIVEPGAGAGLDGYALHPTPAGLEVFTDVSAASTLTLHATYGYPGAGHEDWSTPLLLDDAGNVMAALIGTHGRERVSLFFDNAAWGGVPVAYTQQLGAALLRWATHGVHLGERRNSFQADVDDWFAPTGRWNIDTNQNDDDLFRLSAADALSLRDQQAVLRTVGGGVAPGFTWTMAYNGSGTEQPGEGPIPAACVEDPAATLTYITKCLVGDFWWVSHTWDHEYMDYIPDVGRNLTTADVTANLILNDELAAAYGFGANESRLSLVTGDISGLGWYDPLGPDHTPEAKVDHGLRYSSPYLIQGVVNTQRRYLASNMSTPNHEPDCWGCGTYLNLDDNLIEPTPGFEVLLVPRWPTNVFATVATPEDVVDSYNYYYGENGVLPGRFDHDLTYAEIMDVDSSIGLGHALAGSPYPHYFHVPNAFEYAPARSLLSDWTTELFTKYAALVTEPLLSYKNDDVAAYVQARTDFRAAGVTGTWNRTTNVVTVTSANGGPAFLTGASLGPDAADLEYNGRVISQRGFAANESVTIDLSGAPAPVRPSATFGATPSAIVAGGSATLAWNVTGDATTVSIRTAGGPTLFGDQPRSGSGTVSPTTTTTYELVIAWDGGADVISSATVTVAPAVDPEPTTHTLSLQLTGGGFGLVMVGGQACIDDCELELRAGSTAALTPVALLGSTFDGFSGACEGPTCAVTVDRDLAIGARFEQD